MASQRDQVQDALLRDLEAARYGADRAFRQYDAADPENRLVASELEARWNRALARVGEVEAKIAKHRTITPQPLPMSASQVTALAGNLRAVWTAPTTDARLKKRLVRTLINEVVADLDDGTSEIVLVIHWVGGVHTELRLPKRRRGQRNATPDDIIDAVRQLVLIANNDVIARRPQPQWPDNREWQSLDTRARHCTEIISQYPGLPGPDRRRRALALNLGGAAKLRGITPKTLRLAAEAGEIEGAHSLPDGPWIFSRSKLATQQARQILDRAGQNPRHPTGSHPDQQTLFSSTT